nr:MAG TPA: hypothetical protein [Caudoviricetes sp.]
MEVQRQCILLACTFTHSLFTSYLLSLCPYPSPWVIRNTRGTFDYLETLKTNSYFGSK